MSGQLWLNGLNLRVVGFRMAAMPRFLETPIRTAPNVTIPGRSGGLFLGGDSIELRQLEIEGTFIGSTPGLRETAESVVRTALGTGMIEVRVRNARGAIQVAYALPVNRSSHEPIGPLFRTRGARAVLSLLAEDATWRAEEPTVLALSSTPAVVPLGSASSGFIARAYGPSTNTRLQFYTAGGLLTCEMHLGDLDATDWVEVDGTDEIVTESLAGASANGIARIADDPFPAYGLTPADGAAQTVALLGGGTGELWYWRRDR